MKNNQSHTVPYQLELPRINEQKKVGGALIAKAVESTLLLFLILIGGSTLVCYFIKIDVTVNGTGTLEPVTIWPVRSKETGIVDSIYVASGDTVYSGQPLLQLDSLLLAQQRIDLEYQRSHLLLKKTQLEQLAQNESRQLIERRAEEQARQLQAKAELKDQIVRFGFNMPIDSIEKVIQPGSHIGIDRALADVQMVNSRINQTIIEEAIQKTKGIDVKVHEVEIAQLNSKIKGVSERINRLLVRSPGEGVILTNELEQLTGAYIREGETLIEVASADEWVAVFLVNENDIHKVYEGAPVKIRLKAFDSIFQALYKGHVSTIASEPELERSAIGPGFYRVEAVVENSSLQSIGLERLKEGYSVESKVIVKSGRIIDLIWDYLTERN